MNPEEIKKIIDSQIDVTTKYFWIYILLSGLIAMITAFCIDYIKSKGQNLATKQDITEITNKIEQVKAHIGNNQEVLRLKRELKYKALLDSLTIIDAYISNYLIFEDGRKMEKQFSSAIETRECHNKLILTCEHQETLETFGKILFGEKSSNTEEDIKDLLLNLDKYRNLVRKELSFGDGFNLDGNNVWFAWVNFEKKQ